MNKIRLRTKIETIIAILTLCVIVVASVSSITRMISDNSDSLYNNIWNTRGYVWECSGSNIQLAIDNLSGTNGGTVWVGGDLTLNSAIHMRDNVSLDFQNNIVTLGSNIQFVNFSGCEWASIRNAIVIPSTYHTESIIVLYGSSTYNRCHYNKIENIWIREPSPYMRQHNWTGIHIKMDGDCDIFHNTFRDITTYGQRNGIILESNDADAQANFNTFEDIWICFFINGTVFEDIDGNSFNYNLFTNLKFQTIGTTLNPHSGYTEPCYGVMKISGTGNHFDHCLVWDFLSTCDDPQYSWWIGPYANSTRITIHPNAKFSYNSILDEGLDTTLEMGGQDFPQIYVSDDEPPGSYGDNRTMIWIDSNDNDRSYLCFIWNGELRKVEI